MQPVLRVSPANGTAFAQKHARDAEEKRCTRRSDHARGLLCVYESRPMRGSADAVGPRSRSHARSHARTPPTIKRQQQQQGRGDGHQRAAGH
eukprot:6212499-Pleurochrysis_carterae.AAC.2